MSVVAATDEKTDATTVAIVASDEIAGWSTPHEPTTTPCAHGGSTPFKPTSRVRTEPCFTRLSPPYRGNDHSVLSFVDRASVEAELRSTDRLVRPRSHEQLAECGFAVEREAFSTANDRTPPADECCYLRRSTERSTGVPGRGTAVAAAARRPRHHPIAANAATVMAVRSITRR